MSEFENEMSRRLAELDALHLRRELRRVDSPQGVRLTVEGESLLSFSSNDYLALANHPALKEAAQKAVADFGAGSGASRLLCGSLAPFHRLESALAAFKGTEAQLVVKQANGANQLPAQDPQPLLKQTEEAISHSDYAGALVPLTALRSQPNLTAEQLTAVQDTVAAINKQMAERADAGDPAAQKAMEEYREARRAMRQRR